LKSQSQEELLERRISAPWVAALSSPRESSVDVLQQNDAPLGGVGEEVIKLVVGKTALGEVENADVVLQRAGERLDKGRLAGSWRTVQEVSSTVRDSCAWKESQTCSID